MASEKFRQREVHRYYQAWLDSSVGFDSSPAAEDIRHHGDGSQLRASKDRALIAFAQLGCLRLDAKRGIVTLIGTDQQYILAEATKTLSLISGDGDSAAEDELWFGNASMPRSQGISGDALSPPEYTAIGADGASWTGPALVINDVTLNEKYQSLGYAGKGVTFYCGVPIVTEAGVPVGVYTITDDRPRNGLRPSELRFMHDMAATVMRHFYIISQEAARRRGETMVLGLGRFTSGATSLHDELPSSSQSVCQVASPAPTVSGDDPVRFFKGMTITDANPVKLRWTTAEPKLTRSRPPNETQSVEQSPSKAETKGLVETESSYTLTDPRRSPEVTATGQEKSAPKSHARPELVTRMSSQGDNVFVRAAKILQECVNADGVLFFDAVSTNFARKNKVPGFGTSGEHRSATNASHEPQMLILTEDPKAIGPNSTGLTPGSGGSDESDLSAHNDEERRMCKLLGAALEAPDQTMSNHDFLGDVRMTERNLRRLIKIYPQGKLFSYYVNVGFLASDGEHLTDDASQSRGTDRSNRVLAADKSKRIPRAITDELERLVPNAQSIVWLPIWDFSKQRWGAGLFLWSQRPDRLVAAQDDLVYLKAFANSIMVEVARLDTLMADTAKSTFIANISHELRTPLHGVLGNLDILQDTDLNDFQHEVAAAIEVCGRTLSDTIDHVLDYSKINQLTKVNRRRKQSSSLPLSSLSPNPVANGKTSINDETFDLAAIVEEAVESACASHAFQSGNHVKSRVQSHVGKQQPKTSSSQSGKTQKVYVTLSLEHRDDWLVCSQPSAIRRIVTNLFGNALKYTHSGKIEVTLSSPHSARSWSESMGIPILLSIKDTGMGMSTNFVRNHAFVPFSQESQFSAGTGLGLSIVQQIVRSLRGRIELQSDQGIGTEIKVFLNLPVGHEEPYATRGARTFRLDSSQLSKSGFSAMVLTAEGTGNGPIPPGLLSAVSSLEAIARSWLGLRVISPDRAATSHIDLIIYATPPTNEQLQEIGLSSYCSIRTRFLVVASNLMEKAKLAVTYSDLAAYEGLYVEVLSTPVGPHKLARAVSRLQKPVNDGFPAQGKRETEHDSTPSKTSYPTTSIISNQKRKEAEMSHSEDQQDSVPQLDPTREQRPGGPEMEDGAKLERTFPPHEIIPEDPVSAPEGVLPARPVTFHARSTSSPKPRPVADGTPVLSTLHVLLVDDNDINLNILKACMKRAKIPYEFAKDGLQAKNAFQEAFEAGRAFTHVLMDISMPIMDGIQATREIRDFEQRHNKLYRVSSQSRKSDHAPSLPTSPQLSHAEDDKPSGRAAIIALSGVVSEVTQLEMLEAGADMYLSKPVKMKELLKIFET